MTWDIIYIILFVGIRYVVVLQLLFLFGHLYSIGVWLGEDQQANIVNIHVFERDWTTSSQLY